MNQRTASSLQQDPELSLLESLYTSHSEGMTPSQRDLAGSSGLSLGMTNALLRRFAQRGWIKFSHVTGRSLQYVFTPEGLAEVSRRAILFFTRTARDASLYSKRVSEFVHQAKKRGYGLIVLSGPVEPDFLFDYFCERYGLGFRKITDTGDASSDYAALHSDPDRPLLCIRVCDANDAPMKRISDSAGTVCDEIAFTEILLGTIQWPENVEEASR